MSNNVKGYSIDLSNLQELSYYKWLVLAVVMIGTFISVLDASREDKDCGIDIHL